MDLKNLPAIDFVEKDSTEIERSVITTYEALAGRTLAQGDPIRLFLESITAIIIQQRVLIDYTGKQNLLAYAQDDYLEHLAAFMEVQRLLASAASADIKIKLSQIMNKDIIVPAGVRITAGDDVFFMIASPVTILAGQTEIQSTVVCTQHGTTGNHYKIGQLKQIVDPQPFIDSIVNTTETIGGADTETDDQLRRRVQEAPESFSVAGPKGAYRFWALTASPAIVDVGVYMPTPGAVNLHPLLQNGEMPDENILQAVYDICNDDGMRPLTDHLSVLVPDVVRYNIDVKYYINRNESVGGETIQAAVIQAVNDFLLWTKTALGRDINPTELIYRMRAAGAKRVEVIEPAFTYIKNGDFIPDGNWSDNQEKTSQVAIAQNIKIEFGGLEND